MKEDFIFEKTPSGSERMENGPKVMKDVINDYFCGGQPLAVANRQRHGSDEISAEKGGEV